ncbi:helix-turn-helix transcriptional regulator [Bacillus sp. BRMEA1]|nr:helix-turn-helix transcriptional regulator [Neobacillus endophyticus]
MLQLLAEREMSIAEMVENFPISRTAVNKHLHILSDSALVQSRKVGRETRYTLKPEPLANIQIWLRFFERFWEDKLTKLKRLVEEDHD